MAGAKRPSKKEMEREKVVTLAELDVIKSSADVIKAVKSDWLPNIWYIQVQNGGVQTYKVKG